MQDWLTLYEQAVSESDDAKLKVRLHALETALFLRLQGLAKNGNGNHQSERFAIQVALADLRRLQVERLNFPTFPKEKEIDEITE
jgi:hypothetical protein